MCTTQLRRVDLNLLVALAALLDVRHVSRAADRVGLRLMGTDFTTTVLGPGLARRMSNEAARRPDHLSPLA